MTKSLEIVQKLAVANSCLVKRFRSPPSFTDASRFDIAEMRGNTLHFLTRKHEDSERYEVLANYLSQVSATCAPNLLDGFYSLCISDLPSRNDFTLDFTKLPDFYQMRNYSGLLQEVDLLQLEDKKAKIIFAGASTGELGARDNTRMQVCNWGVENSNFCDFWVTQFVQIDLDDAVNTYGQNLLHFLKYFVSIEEQLTYKFILSVDGNVASWDRLVWIMNSNSLAFKFKSPKIIPDLWYYPLLISGQHYIEVGFDSLREVFSHYLQANAESKKITENAQEFVRNFLFPEVHQQYTLNLLLHADVLS